MAVAAPGNERTGQSALGGQADQDAATAHLGPMNADGLQFAIGAGQQVGTVLAALEPGAVGF
jgi:hypothetical protein